ARSIALHLFPTSERLVFVAAFGMVRRDGRSVSASGEEADSRRLAQRSQKKTPSIIVTPRTTAARRAQGPASQDADRPSHSAKKFSGENPMKRHAAVSKTPMHQRTTPPARLLSS